MDPRTGSALGRERATDGPYEPTRQSLARHPLPEWWDDGKFGIFVHWGAYSVPAFGSALLPGTDRVRSRLPKTLGEYCASEWYARLQQIPGTSAWLHHLRRYGTATTYDRFIERFRAERFDPDDWVSLFAEAGARYFVLTAKHHDGLALWPTATTGRTTAELGPRRDLVGELVGAAREHGGVKPGLYYSVPEWFNPAPYRGGRSSWGESATVNRLMFPQQPPRNAYTRRRVPYTGQGMVYDYAESIVRPQLRELVDRYRPSMIWCDIGGDEDYFRGNETIAYYYNRAAAANPDGVLVNDRFGDGRTHRDYTTVEQGAGMNQQPTGERSEVCRTMAESWGYDTRETADSLRGTGELVHLLVNSVAANANLLLNIGPRADGTIPEPMRERLHGIGAWLKINGEAIYGTRPWTQPTTGNLRCTVGKTTGALYLTALSWPGSELVADFGFPTSERTRITLLGSDGRPLAWRRDGRRLVITTPGADPARATASQHAYVFRVDTQ
ncbi:alpha-L-fucosidase [Amycolatopsis sp. La24]|uniref:alpha-L-fucosidase n=1 Tax=Amycolatopsis sp. La24 TaxID=3028304 RepID=UPI0006924295|nr:alpha-L-fucosidase [Amycolatopsis sp. La24]